MTTIDARGRACPEPVMMTRDGLKQNPEGINVLVDNRCAVENITRYARHEGYEAQVREEKGEFALALAKK